MIIFICISTDIGGYMFGNLFKGPKLTKISPKKTYSGVFGGYLFSIIFIAFSYFCGNGESVFVLTGSLGSGVTVPGKVSSY